MTYTPLFTPIYPLLNNSIRCSPLLVRRRIVIQVLAQIFCIHFLQIVLYHVCFCFSHFLEPITAKTNERREKEERRNAHTHTHPRIIANAEVTQRSIL